MKKEKKTESMKKYFVAHIVYAVIGILLFVPCIYHLLFSGRGISHLSNGNYFEYIGKYINQLAYAFTINTNLALILVIFGLFIAGIIYLYKKSDDKFIIILTVLPSIIYFILAVKLTPFQELRYVYAIVPFISIMLFMILDCIIKVKYKNAIIVTLSIIFVAFGFLFSEPKFLYKNYEKIMKIAEENRDKSFVYVYDNSFNHMQSLPEMMTYEKTLIINESKGEMKYVIEDEQLNKEDSYILSIKSYLDNEKIINEIKDNTEFKNVQKLYSSDESKENPKVNNELYLVSK